jgi:TfoX/Sxy family transcriptional regulator of competence genes
VTGASTRQRSAQTAAGLADDLAELGPVTLGGFFGGTGLRLEDVQFGFVMGGSLYLRVDEVTRPALEQLGGRPFQYQANGRTVTVGSYCEVPEAVRETTLVDWARQAVSTARAARIRRR